MGPSVTGDAKYHHAYDKLLREGATSYVEALLAVGEFERVVEQGCRKVVHEHLTELGNAIHSDLLNDISWPYQTRKADMAKEGVCLATGLTLKGVCEIYFGICWDYPRGDKNSIYAIGTFRFQDRVAFASAWEEFRKVCGHRVEKFADVECELSIRDVIPPDEMPSFQNYLQGILEEWTKAWKRVGGLAGILKL